MVLKYPIKDGILTPDEWVKEAGLTKDELDEVIEHKNELLEYQRRIQMELHEIRWRLKSINFYITKFQNERKGSKRAVGAHEDCYNRELSGRNSG